MDFGNLGNENDGKTFGPTPDPGKKPEGDGKKPEGDGKKAGIAGQGGFDAQDKNLTPGGEPPPKRPPGIAPSGDFDARMAAWGPAAAKACDPVAFMTSGPKGHLARGRDTKLGFFAQARGRLLTVATEITVYLETATDLTPEQRQQLQTLVGALTGFRDLYGAIENSTLSGADVTNPAKREAMTQMVQGASAAARGPISALDPALVGSATVAQMTLGLNEIDVFVGAWSTMAGDPANTDASPQMWGAFLQTVERERAMLNHYGKLAERGGDTRNVKKMAARRQNGATVTSGAEYDKLAAEKGGGMALAIESYSHKAADMAALNAQISVMMDRVRKGEFATQAEAVAAFRAHVGNGAASESYYRQLDGIASGAWSEAAEKARQQKEEEELRRRLAERDANLKDVKAESGAGGADIGKDGKATATGEFGSVAELLAYVTSLGEKVSGGSSSVEIEVKAAVAAVVYMRFEGTFKLTARPDGRYEIESAILSAIGIGAIVGEGSSGIDLAIAMENRFMVKSSGDSVGECVDLIGLVIYHWLSTATEADMKRAALTKGLPVAAMGGGLGIVLLGVATYFLPTGPELAKAMFKGDFARRVVANMNTEKGDKADKVEATSGYGAGLRKAGTFDLGGDKKVSDELTAEYATSTTRTLQKGANGALEQKDETKDWAASAKYKFAAEAGKAAGEMELKGQPGKGKYGPLSEFELKGTWGLKGGEDAASVVAGGIALVSMLYNLFAQLEAMVRTSDDAGMTTRFAQLMTTLVTVRGKIESTTKLAGQSASLGSKLVLKWSGKDDGMKVSLEHLSSLEFSAIAGELAGGALETKVALSALLFEISL